MTIDRRRSLILAAALAWAIASSTTAQTRPDFSGRWNAEAAPTSGASAAQARGDLGSGWGPSIVITQDTATLSVEIVLYSRYDLQPQPVLSYALDGSESRNTLMLGRGMQSQSSRAAWDGDRLRITTVHGFGDPVSGSPQRMEVAQTLTLESPDRLVVEAAWSAVLGGRPSTTRTVYTRN